ncbi:MAG: hypothetical protein JEY79_05555 [Pseudodesulfovibrio sp.]|nr:hypothetical protein [Pseudodesulfovibrio sp.]
MHLDAIAAADLDIFFDETTFAIPATWTVVDGEPVPLSVLFDETYQMVDPETEATIMSTSPRFECRNDQLPANAAEAEEDDVVEVDGRKFSVLEIQPAGLTSFVYLHKERA